MSQITISRGIYLIIVALSVGFASSVASAEEPYETAWIRQIGTDHSDRSQGVSTDADGNVYISGHTYGDLSGPNAGFVDVFVRKYDPSGNLLWDRQMGTTSYDISYAVSADTNGNVYIGGYTGGSLDGVNLGLHDAFITKYDGSGSLLWSRQIGAGGIDIGRGVSESV